MSFSGLKTAVMNLWQSLEQTQQDVCDMSASLQKVCAQVMLNKVAVASSQHPVKQVVLVGGVSANQYLREELALFSELLNTIAKRFTLNNSVEITMEANPGASHLDTLGAYQKAGINRLSIGVQSFNSQHLQLLGRIHNPKDALAMVEHAHTLGFNSINIDIMYGLPLQTPKESVSDVEQALSLPIDHLSGTI